MGDGGGIGEGDGRGDGGKVVGEEGARRRTRRAVAGGIVCGGCASLPGEGGEETHKGGREGAGELCRQRAKSAPDVTGVTHARTFGSKLRV